VRGGARGNSHWWVATGVESPTLSLARQNGFVQRCFLAAEAGEPISEMLQTALATAEKLAWADPHLRAHEGRSARLVLESARTSIATSVNDPHAAVRFFSDRDTALSWAAAHIGAPGAVVTSAIERKAVLAACTERAGEYPEAVVPVDAVGRVDVAAFTQALNSATAAVVAVGNQEIGTCQPVDQIYRQCRAREVPLVVDATMAAGRCELPATWDALVLDARSWAGGNNVSMVVSRPDTQWQTSHWGDSTDRIGAVGVPACAAAALTLEAAVSELGDRENTMRTLSDRLWEGLLTIPEVAVHGDYDNRLPHIVGFSALYIDAESLLLELDRVGISLASGSACAADDGNPSHVLAAMGALTSGNLRVTLPTKATDSCIDRLLRELPPILQHMRTAAGL
jgi:cysteine desulfurase